MHFWGNANITVIKGDNVHGPLQRNRGKQAGEVEYNNTEGSVQGGIPRGLGSERSVSLMGKGDILSLQTVNYVEIGLDEKTVLKHRLNCWTGLGSA